MSSSQQAYQTLVDLSRLCRRSSRGLPAQVDIRPHWSGVGFSLLGQFFVAPMGEVTEMLEVPSFTRLPGVMPWVKGVANVRGRLLPLFDMGNFFGGRLGGHRKQRRVLILESGDIYTGLEVDQVFGMKHFPIDTYSEQNDYASEAIKPFTQGSYELDGRRWALFSPAMLALDDRFANAAAG
jgi:twitching motility protein PilI|tara:strand:+ start:3120 stop:3662 length:543 start_codon:yes stop_codon:yes gene_type:complete